MRRIVAVLMLAVFLGGCAASEPMDRALVLRQKLLEGEGCRFRAQITADYGGSLQTFVLDCETDREGNLDFTVASPETISGIAGTVAEAGGSLTFEDQILAFPPLAEGQVAPVTAPWILIHTLRSGYLRSCGQTAEGLRLTVDDSYQEDALQVDIWLGAGDLPVAAEILWDGRRILSLQVENFELL